MFLKGVVEDVTSDPLKLGRIKVRIIGKHTPNKTSPDDYDFLRTEELPYAIPISPVGASNISGISNFSVPEINSIVVCGYFDDDEQELFYIGTLGLIGKTKIEGFGIIDNPNPSTEYPFSNQVVGTNEIVDPTAATNTLFALPVSPYATVYPDNKVIKTKSGHVIELDDSDGAERIRIFHTSGSLEEHQTNGDTLSHSVKDKYISSKDNLNLSSDNMNVQTKTDLNGNIGGKLKIEITSTCEILATGHTTIKGAGVDLNGGGTVKGVVQADCICPFTGKPHAMVSATVKATV
jgi:hypothetical protein